MHHTLPRAIPDFSKTSLLVVGDIMLDRYWFGETSRISPEAPVPIVKVDATDHRPGGAGNVALNIAALGAKIALLGVVGHDEAATILQDQLTAASVEHDFCIEKELSTIIKLRVMSRRQQLLRLDFEKNLSLYNQDHLIERYQKHLTNTKLVILSDYKKGTLTNPQQLIKLARAANIPILIDPKSHDFSIYANANIITPNYKEFEAVVGICHNEEEIIKKGRKLLTQYSIDALLVTRSANGMTLITAEEALYLPAYAREVLDVTGAGDTVISVLGTAIASGMPLAEAAALSNLAASLAVAKLGAATVSSPELVASLTDKTSHVSGIVNRDQLLQLVTQARMQGKKIVFTNGCFDILHAGHVMCLQMAKQLGDFLIVAVNEDQSIRKIKGPNRPINHLEHRMMVLAGLGVVDWVVPFPEDTPEALLQLIRPDLLIKGGDYEPNQVVGADIVRAYGGEVRVLGDKISSSSHLISRMTNNPTSKDKENQHYG